MPTAHNLRRDAAVAREKADAILADAKVKAAKLLTDAGVDAAKLVTYAEALDAAADAQEGLQTRNGYGTVRRMDATVSVTKPEDFDSRAAEGPMTDLARSLGLHSLQELATALGVGYGNVRVMNNRGAISAPVQKKVDDLKKRRGIAETKK